MNAELQPVICVLNPDDVYYLKNREHSALVENCKTPAEVRQIQQQGLVFPKIEENVVYMRNPLKQSEYIIRNQQRDLSIIEERIRSHLPFLASFRM